MSSAQFCPVCGECISDGCQGVDEDGNELPVQNYTPCQCVTGIDSNGRIVDSEKAAAYACETIAERAD